MNLKITATDENGQDLVNLTVYQDGSDSECAEAIHNFIVRQFDTDEASRAPVMSTDWLANSLRHAAFIRVEGVMYRVDSSDADAMIINSTEVCLHCTEEDSMGNQLAFSFGDLYRFLKDGELDMQTLVPIVGRPTPF